MKTYRIIMIDDNPIDCLLMREAMASVDFQVEFSQILNGLDGSDFIQEHADNIDLLILDLNLPGKSGIELLTQIRQKNSTKRLPVIMFSTSNMREDVISAYEMGANAYLLKPDQESEFNAVANGIVHFWGRLGQLNLQI